jgi:PucR family transcriptional regulator, purine catabolism regulatory protein
MNLDSFISSRIVAGMSGADNIVENISVLEVTDIVSDFVRGDFLLSTLYPVYNNESQLKDIIFRFSEMGLSGLGIKMNRYTESIPEIFIEQANELGFPLVILPQSSNFTVQINDFLIYKNQINSNALQYQNDIHNVLLDIMLKGEDYGELSKSLATMIDKNIMLLNLSFEVISDYRLEETSEIDFEINETCLKKKFAGNDNFVLYSINNIKSYIYSVQFGYEKIGYIVVYSSKEFSLDEKDKIAIERYAAVLSIIIQKHRTVAEIEKRYAEEFAIDLILEKIKLESSAVSRAKKLGWNFIFPITMIVINIIDFSGNDKYYVLEVIKKKIFNELIGGKENSTNLFVSNYEQYLLIFVNKLYINKIKQINDIVNKALVENEITKFYIGITKNIKDLSEIPKRYGEGKLAVKIAQNINSSGPLFFNDIGIYRILDSISNKLEIKEYCLDILGNLIKYDEIHKTDLLNTLVYIINEDGNLKKASSKMFIHYNTIRYRFNKIEELLGRKLESIISYQDVYIAIKIYETLK